MQTVKALDLKAQYDFLKTEIDAAISSVISDTAFIGGHYVKKFEQEFASYLGAAHCVAVGNGTDAIEIVLESLCLPAHSEVLVPANSFIATSEAVTRVGHRVVFCDCDPATYTVCLKDAARRLTPRTRAIIPVHLYGQPCHMSDFVEFALANNLKLIEDCSQAHGATHQGQRVGTFGNAATFSFYPGKNLGAYGDAGAIVCGDETLAESCRMLANHGRITKYDHEFEGRNSRMDGLQGAILSVKLTHLEDFLERRIEVAGRYQSRLAECAGLRLPSLPSEGDRHVYHLYVICTTDREKLRDHLQRQGIETGIHYPKALPKLPAYSYLGQADEEMHANRLDSQILSLPVGEHLSDQEVDFVATSILEFYAQG